MKQHQHAAAVERRYLRADEAAKYTGLTEHDLKRARRAGDGPHYVQDRPEDHPLRCARLGCVDGGQEIRFDRG